MEFYYPGVGVSDGQVGSSGRVVSSRTDAKAAVTTLRLYRDPNVARVMKPFTMTLPTDELGNLESHHASISEEAFERFLDAVEGGGDGDGIWERLYAWQSEQRALRGLPGSRTESLCAGCGVGLGAPHSPSCREMGRPAGTCRGCLAIEGRQHDEECYFKGHVSIWHVVTEGSPLTVTGMDVAYGR